MKTALYFSTLLALALADKPSPAYTGASSVAAASPDVYASPQAQSADTYRPAEAAEPVAPSTQGFYYYYYPVSSSYDDNSVQKQPQQGYGGQGGYAPDRTETVGGGGGSGLSGPFLGVIGVLAVAAIGAAVFMTGGVGRRAFSNALTSVDFDDVAYYVYQGIQFWTDVQKQ